MLEWLEAQGHWGFITVSYALAGLILAADLLSQRLRQSELRRRVLERRARRRLQGSH